jgi:hypothetical protein
MQDPVFAISLAERAYSWHSEKDLYFLLFAKLLPLSKPHAYKLLSTHFAMFLPYVKLAGYLQDHDVYDQDIQTYFTRAFTQQA